MMIKLTWDEATKHASMIHELMTAKEVSVTSIEVVRLDGSTVRIVYFPRPDCFMARRYRADGRLGASKAFHGDLDGLMKAFRHMLPVRLRGV